MTPLLRVGRYAVFEAIGSGGMATVHLGRLHGAGGFGRTVAIKRLHASFADSEAFAARFVAEAKIASRVQHPNVVTIIDALAADGELLLVMDHVLGEPLSELLQHGALPADVAVAIGIDVLRGLHAAHEAVDERGERLELVHRDVSPHNVMVGVDGVARLLDFGIARATQESGIEDDEAVEGKVAYMAPEQLYGETVDRRSDVYAVGVVLWECLTGRRLFIAGAGQSTATRVLEERVQRPSIESRDLPDGLDAVVMRALARDASSRYADAAAMEHALRAVMPPAPPGDVAEVLAARCGASLADRRGLVGAVEAATPEDAAPAPGEDAGHRGKWIAAALALIGGVAWWAVPAAPPATEATSPPPATTTASATVAPPPAPAPTPAPPPQPVASALPEPAPSIAPRVAAPRPEPSAEAAADPCDPPFVLDENGHKRYKRGCFH